MISEHSIHATIADWLNLHARMMQFQWVHIPGGGHMSPAMGARRKRLGARAGTPDLCIVFQGGRLLWLEVKTAKGKLSPSQREFRGECYRLEIPYAVVRSVEDVEKALRIYGEREW